MKDNKTELCKVIEKTSDSGGGRKERSSRVSLLGSFGAKLVSSGLRHGLTLSVRFRGKFSNLDACRPGP